jgi:lipid-A-disaccharide synthase
VVGHPAVEAAAEPADGAAFRVAHGIPAEAPLLAVLPGSRKSEVARLAPVFAATLAKLASDFPGLRAVVPTVPNVAPLVRAAAEAWPVETLVLEGPAEKYAAFAAADAALAASGTVAVELAVARCPTVVAYRVSALSAAIARRMLKVRFVSLANLVLDRAVQPELLQENCTPQRLADAVRPLLADGKARERQLADLDRVLAALSGAGDGPPSRQAACAVLRVIADRG